LLKDPSVNVIHAHWVLPQGFALAVARVFTKPVPPGKKLVLSFHSGRDANMSRLYTRVEKWILRRFDLVTVNNRKTQKLLSEIHGRTIEYLPMGLPDDVERRPFRATSQKDYSSVVSIGRFVPVKGYLELLHAWSARKDELTGYRLTLLGNGG